MVRTAVAAAVAAIALAGLAGSTPVGAQTGPQSAEPPGWILVDADTGEVLDGRDVHSPRYTASLAKIMTSLTAVERLPPETPIVASDRAASQPGSRIGLETGDVWTLEDGLAALILQSGNDMAYAIAEAAGGDLDGFATALNETAARYGMTNTTLGDPAGFDAPGEAYGDGPRMSPFDVAIATRNAMAVPRLAAVAAIAEYPFTDEAGDARVMANKNRLLPGGDRAYPWATGFKTGFTRQAGHTFVGTAERDGRRLIAVVMGTWDFYGWGTQLLEQGFAADGTGGTAERLPEVRVSPFAQRQADLDAFLALTLGSGAAGEPPTTPGVGTTAGGEPGAAAGTDPEPAEADAGGADPAGSEGAGREAAAGADAGAAPVAQTTEDDEARRDEARSRGGLVSWRTIAFAVIVLLTGGVVLRRRAVRRQRARRLARQREMRRAISRGQLPTVDGHHRLGTRTGSRMPVRAGGYRPDRPPPSSHVQLHPLRPRDNTRDRARDRARDRRRE